MAINTFSGNGHAGESLAQYTLHTNLIAVGWTSQGEGNGTTGGMGITGIVTSGNYRWSVLKHPTSDRQVIITTEGSDGTSTSPGAIGYSYDGSLSGGSATAHPRTGNYAVSGYDLREDLAGTKTFVGMVQDTEPYCFHLQGRRDYFSAITYIGSISFVYLDSIQSHDVDPYLVTRGCGILDATWQFTPNNVGVAVCLKPGSTTEYMNVRGQTIGPINSTNLFMWPGYANTNSDGYYVDAPILWARNQFSDPLIADGYKGISSSVFRSCGVVLATDKTTQQASFNNQTWLYCGHGVMIPWDGGTVYDFP